MDDRGLPPAAKQRVADVLGDIFDGRWDEDNDQPLFLSNEQAVVTLVLVAEGVKPAATIDNYAPREWGLVGLARRIAEAPLYRVCADAGIPHQVDVTTKTHRKPAGHAAIHIAVTDEAFDPLAENGDYHRQMGEFYGYPDEAVRAFDAGRHARPADLPGLADEACIDRKTAGVLALVMYMPQETPAGVREAVRRGEENEQAIRRFADQYDLDALHDTVDAMKEGFRNQLD